jgi:pimeloyl-ACP methyl ester carboxylesterase
MRNAESRPSHHQPSELPRGATEAFLDLDGERVRVVQAGQTDGPTVLLLHGWGASAYNFRLMMPGLAAAGFHVVAPDLRGHGRSDKPERPDAYTSGAMAAHVIDLVDRLGVVPAVVVGQSIGGAIVLDVAARRPDLVPAAVLLSSIGFTRLRRVDVLRRLAVWRWGRPRGHRWVIRLVMHRIYGVRRRWTAHDIDAYLDPLRDPRAVAALLSLIRSFDFEPRDPSAVAYLGGRLRLVFGERDRPIPCHEAMRHARRFAGARLTVLAGVGHVPAEEVPDEMIAAIIDVARPAGHEAAPARKGAADPAGPLSER